MEENTILKRIQQNETYRRKIDGTIAALTACVAIVECFN